MRQFKSLLVTTGKIGCDGVVERIIFKAFIGAIEVTREQIAARQVGNLTYNQAMQLVAEDKMVTRPAWGILIPLWEGDFGEGPEPCLYRLGLK
jgi:hypothetical protein